ncbi:MAG: molecular chaperone TorD family protein, partial [Pyrinomonadaceae bacterium]
MELFRALAVLAEPPDGPQTARVSDALGLGTPPGASEYTETFVLQLYPYASVYLGAEGMLGGEARARIAGFWRALGQTPPVEADHLSLLLALYARLAELESGEGEEGRRGGWRGARKALLWEHLLSWLPVYLAKLDDIATPFYRGWGELLEEALLEEARTVGRQELLSTHLREAPAPADPREVGAEDFLSSLLAPARSGMILTRADLNRAARGLNLGSRIGERKYMLKALMGQDSDAMLGWLAEEARTCAVRHA